MTSAGVSFLDPWIRLKLINEKKLFPLDTTHNFRAGTINNFDGAKNVNTGANYGAPPNVVVHAYLISNLT